MTAVLRTYLCLLVALGTAPLYKESDSRTHEIVTVSGVITDMTRGGQGATGAAVVISSSRREDRQLVAADTGGNFRVQVDAPDDLTLVPVKPGWVPWSNWVGGQQSVQLRVVPGGDSRVVLPMFRASGLSGRITDKLGNPLAGVFVFALDSEVAEPLILPGAGQTLARTETGPDGQFRFDPILPGSYYVVGALPRSLDERPAEVHDDRDVDSVLAGLESGKRVSWTQGPSRGQQAVRNRARVPIYFPGTSSRNLASVITVEAGESADGLDFAVDLVDVRSLFGQVTPAVAGLELAITSQATIGGPILSSGDPVLVSGPGADGSFQYASLTPGRYVISARSTSEDLVGSATVDVADADSTGLTIPLHRPAHCVGQVQLDGNDAMVDLSKNLRLVLRSAAPGLVGTSNYSTRIGAFANESSCEIGSAGHFDCGQVQPGNYRFALSWLKAAMEPLTIEAIIGPSGALDDAVLTLGLEGQDTTVRIAATTSRASVQGRVTGPETISDLRKYEVRLVPANRSQEDVFPRKATVAADGQYAIKGVRPGSYVLSAIRAGAAGRADDVPPEEITVARNQVAVVDLSIR